MNDLNDARAAKVALEQVWRQLALVVAEARALEAASVTDSSVLNDPWAQAEVDFVSFFSRELGAIQTIYEGAEAGAKLSADVILTGYVAGRKLVETVEKTREQLAVQLPKAVA